MSGKGNCFDNAVVETFFKTLKSELVWRTVFQTRAEAKKAIGCYIDGFYNPVRCHSTLDYVKSGSVRRAGRIATKPLSTKPKQIQGRIAHFQGVWPFGLMAKRVFTCVM